MPFPQMPLPPGGAPLFMVPPNMMAAMPQAAPVSLPQPHSANGVPPPAPEAPPPGKVPDTTRAYRQADGARLFMLTESEMDKLPYTSVRNLSGPFPIRVYQGADLLTAAIKKYRS